MNADGRLELMMKALQKNPELLESVLNFFAKPPIVGSVKIQFRDGRVHNVEQVRITY